MAKVHMVAKVFELKSVFAVGATFPTLNTVKNRLNNSRPLLRFLIFKITTVTAMNKQPADGTESLGQSWIMYRQFTEHVFSLKS